MGNGTRHLFGALAGVVAIPVLFALLGGGLGYIGRGYEVYARDPTPLYLAAALTVIAAVIAALLAATRISPLASLIPGLALLVLGGGGVAAPSTIVRLLHDVLTSRVSVGGWGMNIPLGVAAGDALIGGGYLLVGALLLIASLAPSRWRGGTSAAGAHRAAPAAATDDDPWPSPPVAPSDPANHRATPPLPGEDPYPGHEYPYGAAPPAQSAASGPRPAYGAGPEDAYGAGRQAAYGEDAGVAGPSGYGPGERPSSWSGPQRAYGSGPQEHYGAAPDEHYGWGREDHYGSGPRDPYGQAAAPQEQYGAPPPEAYPQGHYGSGPQNPYGQAAAPQGPYGAAPQDPYGAAAREAYGAAPREAYGQGGETRAPFEAYGRGHYGQEPWGAAPGDEDAPPTRAYSPEGGDAPRADPTPRTLPDASPDATTNRIPWSEEDRTRFRDGR